MVAKLYEKMPNDFLLLGRPLRYPHYHSQDKERLSQDIVQACLGGFPYLIISHIRGGAIEKNMSRNVFFGTWVSGVCLLSAKPSGSGISRIIIITKIGTPLSFPASAFQAVQGFEFMLCDMHFVSVRFKTSQKRFLVDRDCFL